MSLNPVVSTGYWKYSVKRKNRIKSRTNKIKIKLEKTNYFFDVLLTVHLSIILAINQLNAQILVLN